METPLKFKYFLNDYGAKVENVFGMRAHIRVLEYQAVVATASVS